MQPAQRLNMLRIAESLAPRPEGLLRESGLGGPDSVAPGVDDHLKHAVAHAHASLKATRSGDHAKAAEHAKVAKAHLGHASAKQNAEEHPDKHPGEKMVFGVWRKTGEMTPADHQAAGDKYTKHAQRQKARIDARAMLGGVHPNEVSDSDKKQHYREVHQSLAAAKTHYAGQDPMKHTGDAGVQRTGASGKPPVTAHGQSGDASAPPKSSPHVKRHQEYAKSYGDQQKPWKIVVPDAEKGGHKSIGTHHGTYQSAWDQASKHPEFHSPGTKDHRGSIEPADHSR